MSQTTHFRRLVEAIYHICDSASAHPEMLDQIKLNKVLWYADASAYLQRGESITGEVYIKKPFGPVARHNRNAVAQLEAAGALRRGKSASGSGYWNTHFDITGDFPREVLTEDEVGIIDKVYQSIVGRNLTSMDISERTHGEIWQLAVNNEQLSLFTVFAERLGEVTDQYMDLARQGF